MRVSLEELQYLKMSTLMPANKPQMIAIKGCDCNPEKGSFTVQNIEHSLAKLGRRVCRSTQVHNSLCVVKKKYNGFILV